VSLENQNIKRIEPDTEGREIDGLAWEGGGAAARGTKFRSFVITGGGGEHKSRIFCRPSGSAPLPSHNEDRKVFTVSCICSISCHRKFVL
jgi:hypothetical protein